MQAWISIEKELPFPREEVTIRTHRSVRPGYFRIGDRWYALVDLERWTMKTSPFWPEDRSWYLTTDEVEAWMPEMVEDAASAAVNR